MWTHWVTRTNHPHAPFMDPLEARSAWQLISRQFPEMLAGVLMPNHLHLLLPQNLSERSIRDRIHGFKGAVSSRTNIHQLWQPTPPPQPIPDRHHLRRLLRYIALNPCRKNLCRDPIEWYWSSYRELFGASAGCKRNPAAIAHALNESSEFFLKKYHRYVSADESVAASGTALPHPARSDHWTEYSLQSILDASAAALRLPAPEVRARGPLRGLFIQMALLYQHSNPRQLATICGLSERSIQRAMKIQDVHGMAAAMLCLGEPRLRRPQLVPSAPQQNTGSCLVSLRAPKPHTLPREGNVQRRASTHSRRPSL